jgi:hypothetical protein
MGFELTALLVIGTDCTGSCKPNTIITMTALRCLCVVHTSIQHTNLGSLHCVATFCDKFVSDLWQVCGFLWVPRFPPQIKLTALRQVGGFLRFPPPIKLTHDITEILLKVVLSTIILILNLTWNRPFQINIKEVSDHNHNGPLSDSVNYKKH